MPAENRRTLVGVLRIRWLNEYMPGDGRFSAVAQNKVLELDVLVRWTVGQKLGFVRRTRHFVPWARTFSIRSPPTNSQIELGSRILAQVVPARN